MKAIPAIDLIDGKTVRLLQGNFERQTTYPEDPVEYATRIFEAGIDRLHLVDLSGAKAGNPIHADILRQIAETTKLKIDFGGGVKTIRDLDKIFRSGAEQVVIGSWCVREPETVLEWVRQYGTKRFVLALDTDGEFIRINGWQETSGRTLEKVLESFLGLNGLDILTTDIRRDGMGQGPSVDLYARLIAAFSQFNWIASGGVENLRDLYALREVGCTGCVVGKALLDGKISLQQLKTFNDE